MANQEQVEILKQGAEPWNEWRRKYQSLMPDLDKADLEDANLNGADLRRGSLMFANLIGADLTGANLSGANLSHAKLASAGTNGRGNPASRGESAGADKIRATVR